MRFRKRAVGEGASASVLWRAFDAGNDSAAVVLSCAVRIPSLGPVKCQDLESPPFLYAPEGFALFLGKHRMARVLRMLPYRSPLFRLPQCFVGRCWSYPARQGHGLRAKILDVRGNYRTLPPFPSPPSPPETTTTRTT